MPQYTPNVQDGPKYGLFCKRLIPVCNDSIHHKSSSATARTVSSQGKEAGCDTRCTCQKPYYGECGKGTPPPRESGVVI